MRIDNRVITFLEKNNGSITTKQFENLGIKRYEIQEYIDAKIVSRIARGIYISNNSLNDILYNYQIKHNNTIFSYNTSLYILGFINEPNNIDITTYRGNNPVENRKVKIHWVSKNKLNLGVILNKTKSGNIVKVYNLERTLCDIIKNDNFSDPVYAKILKWYFIKNKENMKLLLRYAELMKITTKLKMVMEILES